MDKQIAKKDIQQTDFPPVVAVLGHVDHGKTSLLDAVRRTSIADREFGGITQSIGASSVEIVYEDKKRWITFLDTPGHEAFSKMRSRGAQAADIGLLIVSIVDGVMPQTRESIQLLQQAGIPYIVVLTKADLPGKNIEKVKQQLIRENIILEGYGGDVPVIEISSKTNLNIKELLDLILLVTDLRSEKRSAEAPLQAIVIESRLDSKVGPRATVVIKNGTIRVREEVSGDAQVFRIRTLVNDRGVHVQEATVGEAVEIIGTEKVLSVGSIVADKKDVQEESVLRPKAQSGMRELVYMKPEENDNLSLILVANTQGSLEAIVHSLPEDVEVLVQKTGEVTEADVLHAKSTGSLVLSFNIKLRPDVIKLAATEKVLVRNYNIIYEMLDEIKDVLEGKKLARIESVYGTAKVQAKFPFEKTFAYGIKVMDGRVARGDKIRIMREEAVIGETTIQSLRVAKNTVSKVEKGHEAGIVFNSPLDITIGDMLVCVG